MAKYPKLKPCPFCGNRQKWRWAGHGLTHVCADCGAVGPLPENQVIGYSQESDEQRDLAAIEAWNRRVR